MRVGRLRRASGGCTRSDTRHSESFALVTNGTLPNTWASLPNKSSLLLPNPPPPLPPRCSLGACGWGTVFMCGCGGCLMCASTTCSMPHVCLCVASLICLQHLSSVPLQHLVDVSPSPLRLTLRLLSCLRVCPSLSERQPVTLRQHVTSPLDSMSRHP